LVGWSNMFLIFTKTLLEILLSLRRADIVTQTLTQHWYINTDKNLKKLIEYYMCYFVLVSINSVHATDDTIHWDIDEKDNFSNNLLWSIYVTMCNSWTRISRIIYRRDYNSLILQGNWLIKVMCMLMGLYSWSSC
jgi:hypothetical protein